MLEEEIKKTLIEQVNEHKWDTRLEIIPHKRVNGQDPGSVGLGCDEKVNKRKWDTHLDVSPEESQWARP